MQLRYFRLPLREKLLRIKIFRAFRYRRALRLGELGLKLNEGINALGESRLRFGNVTLPLCDKLLLLVGSALRGARRINELRYLRLLLGELALVLIDNSLLHLNALKVAKESTLHFRHRAPRLDELLLLLR